MDPQPGAVDGVEADVGAVGGGDNVPEMSQDFVWNRKAFAEEDHALAARQDAQPVGQRDQRIRGRVLSSQKMGSLDLC